MNDTNSLAHTKWRGKYHIVFSPKYRKKYSMEKSERNRANIKRTMRMETNKYSTSKSMPILYSYVGRNTTENECIWVCRIFKRKK